MAGHSKWAQIKRQKASTDAKRSKLFGKLSRLIALESRRVGGKTDSPSLRTVIEKAKAANMPAENIERAIRRGAGGEGEDLAAVLYEAYGPGGVALVIEGLTDNKNRTAAELKHLLGKHGASLAAPGAAVWAFEKTEEGFVPRSGVPLSGEDGSRFEKLLEEVEEHDDVQEVYTNAEFAA